GAGLFGIGRPRLCNGANLAYRRASFDRIGGFAGHRNIASGDDEFLVQSIVYRQGGRVVFATADKAIVRCRPSQSLGAFLAQRARWASKGLRYTDGRFRVFLVVLFAFFCAGTLMPLAAAQSLEALAGAIAFFGAKAFLDAVILVLSARLFKVRFRWADWAVAELFHPFYLVTVSLLGTLCPYRWKGRTHR
ncbi:MAG: glycosyltransferase family 2 protein, partial [Bacteroidota bacterium]|nr:glycosyltransferase family 2 protein [Bacteroidota bacterium]